MNKYIKKVINYNKSLEINEEALLEIDKLYKEFETNPIYSIITDKDIYYEFENITELLDYKFDEKIVKLTINGQNKNTINLKFKFEIEDTFIILYSSILKVYYSTHNENYDILLEEKISNFCKKHRNYNWIIGKFGFLFYFFVTISIYDLIILLFKGINNNFNINDFWNWYIPTAIPGAILLYLLRKLDIFVCQKFFNPLTYNIGKQKKTFNKITTIKSNIFWGIIVATIVGIITTIICNIILK